MSTDRRLTAMRTARARHSSGGFTLMEMVTSCVILSMLMLSLGYGLKLALVSTGSGAAQSVASLEASDIVERVTDDLNEALNFTEKTAQAATFTVPDRGTDGSPDKIRYQWWPSGGTFTIPAGQGGGLVGGLVGGLAGIINGDSSTTVTVPAYTLTRQFNDGDISVLGRDVRSFNLNYLYRTMSPPASTAPPPDRMLWQHDPIVGLPQNYAVNFDRWIGETFLPQLPAGTTSWSITRIALYLRGDLTCDGVLKVTLRAVNGSNWPTTVLATASIGEVALEDSYRWVEFPFTTLNNLSPTTKYAIVIEGVTGTTTYGTASWVSTSLPPSGTWLVTTSTRGVPSWTVFPLNSLRYKIYGTTTP